MCRRGKVGLVLMVKMIEMIRMVRIVERRANGVEDGACGWEEMSRVGDKRWWKGCRWEWTIWDGLECWKDEMCKASDVHA